MVVQFWAPKRILLQDEFGRVQKRAARFITGSYGFIKLYSNLVTSLLLFQELASLITGQVNDCLWTYYQLIILNNENIEEFAHP